MQLTYTQLHLFLLVPIALLLLVPPRLLPAGTPAMRRFAWTFPLVIVAMAFAFSSAWDNYIAARGVWVVEADRRLGAIGPLPLEEYFWFIDHTLLASFWTLRCWPTQPRGNPPRVAWLPLLRVLGVLGSLGMSVVGVWLWAHNEHALYLGVLLAFCGPVLAFQWGIGLGYLYKRWRETLLGILPVSAYVLLLDFWAVKLGVWHISPRFTTGIFWLGIHLEHWVVYVLPTVLVVQTLVIALDKVEAGRAVLYGVPGFKGRRGSSPGA